MCRVVSPSGPSVLAPPPCVGTCALGPRSAPPANRVTGRQVSPLAKSQVEAPTAAAPRQRPQTTPRSRRLVLHPDPSRLQRLRRSRLTAFPPPGSPPLVRRLPGVKLPQRQIPTPSPRPFAPARPTQRASGCLDPIT